LPSDADAAGDGEAESNAGGAIDIAVSPLKRLGREFSERILGTFAVGKNSNSTESFVGQEIVRVRDAIKSAANKAKWKANTTSRVTYLGSPQTLG
jgi:hypothetical protein